MQFEWLPFDVYAEFTLQSFDPILADVTPGSDEVGEDGYFDRHIGSS